MIKNFIDTVAINIMLFSLGKKGKFISHIHEGTKFDDFKLAIENEPSYIHFKHKSKYLPHQTVLSQCISKGLEEHTLYLIDKGANIHELSSTYQEYPILLAARKGLLRVMEKMISQGVDLKVVNWIEQDCLSAFFYQNPCRDSFVQCIHLLKKNNFDFNHVDSKGNNILFKMAEQQFFNNEAAIEAMLNTNINLAHKNKNGLDFFAYYEILSPKSPAFAPFIEKYMLDKQIQPIDDKKSETYKKHKI